LRVRVSVALWPAPRWVVSVPTVTRWWCVIAVAVTLIGEQTAVPVHANRSEIRLPVTDMWPSGVSLTVAAGCAGRVGREPLDGVPVDGVPEPPPGLPPPGLPPPGVPPGVPPGFPAPPVLVDGG
jgi:hypothetical protein